MTPDELQQCQCFVSLSSMWWQYAAENVEEANQLCDELDGMWVDFSDIQKEFIHKQNEYAFEFAMC